MKHNLRRQQKRSEGPPCDCEPTIADFSERGGEREAGSSYAIAKLLLHGRLPMGSFSLWAKYSEDIPIPSAKDEPWIELNHVSCFKVHI